MQGDGMKKEPQSGPFFIGFKGFRGFKRFRGEGLPPKAAMII